MDESLFEQVLRKAARQVTRRGALGVLVGSALLLSGRGESDATK